jgi:hypothetical protein
MANQPPSNIPASQTNPSEEIEIAGESLHRFPHYFSVHHTYFYLPHPIVLSDDSDASETPLPALLTVWHDTKFSTHYNEDNGQADGWICGWCTGCFRPKHATRVLFHCLRIKGRGIKPCTALIPDKHLNRLQALYDTSVGKAEALKRTAVAIEASTEQRQ